MTKIFDVIRKPLLTEKGQLLREKNIRTVRIPSRTKRLGRFVGTSSPRKKAYVELAEGAPASE